MTKWRHVSAYGVGVLSLLLVTAWRHVSAYGVGVLSLLLVTACGSSSDSSKAKPEVATLGSPAATSTNAGGKSANQRPIIRPDMSSEEVIAIDNVYSRCLGDRGVPVLAQREGKLLKALTNESDPQHQAAMAACADKNPEYWQEIEARTDPRYRDRLRDVVKCLADQGVQAEIKGIHVSFTDDRQVGRALELHPVCEKKVFADVYERYKKSNGK